MCFSCFHLARNNTQLEVEEYWGAREEGAEKYGIFDFLQYVEAGIYGSYREAFNVSACDLKIFCFLVVRFSFSGYTKHV